MSHSDEAGDLLRLSPLSRHLSIPLRTLRNRIAKGQLVPRLKYGVKLYSVKQAKRAFGIP